MIAAMTEERKPATQKIVLWVGMASIVMLFAGLTSGYIVRMAEGNWKEFSIPVEFYISTAFILLSSLTMQLAMSAVKKDNLPAVKRWLMVTLGLGLAFTFSQVLGYNALTQDGVFFVDKTTPSGSFFYAITGLHLAHVAFGILALMFTTGKSILEKYNSGNYLGISLCAIYWHFLDGLWIYLFVFLANFR
jgi:cytochrome c oxidase subunit 3